jgi:aryl-alcohol dehydrogenase-like predicted oxidoreductase
METRQLGSTGPVVSALSLGCMGMSAMYGHADEAESIRTLHAALERGVTLLDTGDFYGMGHNEMLIGRALRSLTSFQRDKLVLSVKFGAMRAPTGAWLGYDARPAAVKNFLAYSLNRLGVDYIDIYRAARLDPAVPVEETVGAIAQCIKTGQVRHVGLSELGAANIRKAAATHPICDLQIEYAVVTRNIEREILPTLRELGIGVTAYGVLSRGLLSGSTVQEKGDIRSYLPRFSAANLEKNRQIVAALQAIATRKGCTVAQLCIAWALAQGKDIVPIVGARKVSQLDEALAALDVTLSPADLAAIEEAAPAGAIQGDRYDPMQMKKLDSEKHD